jgi:signal transduction histidine kinase
MWLSQRIRTASSLPPPFGSLDMSLLTVCVTSVADGLCHVFFLCQVADFDARLAELMKQVQEGEARVKELEMRAMRKDHLSQQVTRLEAELETAKMDLTKAKNHAVEAQEAARSAEIAWDKRINELESELREARTDVEDMDRQL